MPSKDAQAEAMCEASRVLLFAALVNFVFHLYARCAGHQGIVFYRHLAARTEVLRVACHVLRLATKRRSCDESALSAPGLCARVQERLLLGLRP